ncbi:MAG: ROK family protein, partial [Patescibacteria group bacterium]
MYLLFDIGGTKMRIGVAENFKKISKTVILPTPKSFADGMALFEKAAKELASGKKIEAVAGGITGPLDKNKTMILNALNLRGWSKKPLVKELKKIFKVPVFLENDAALAGLGEATFGAGVGKKIVAYLTVSTGVGGARIVNEKIDQNAFGFEPGHQIIFLNKEAITLENMVSGTAIEKKYGKKPYEIYDGKIWDKVAKNLAYGLHNVTVLWSPDIIILGGSVMKSLPVERVQYHLSKILKIFPKPPLIKKSKLGDLAGLHGALA